MKNTLSQLIKFDKKSILLILIILLIVFSIIYLGIKSPKNFTDEKNAIDGKRPNIVLISVDSLGANHVSSYGYYRKTTPNIDNLAKEGVLFKNHISQAYLTPISEMAVHTGMYPSSNGFFGFDTVLPKNITILAQILKTYNYRSAAFGNSPEFVIFPAILESFNRGFDVYDFQNKPLEQSRLFPQLYRAEPVSQEKILNFLNKDKEKPFFLWLALGSAHFPYGKFPKTFGEQNYNGILKNKNLDWHSGILPWIYKNAIYQQTDDGKMIAEKISNEDIQYIIDSYDDDIFATDKWIGDFLSQIKKNGFEENTIIIIQSEHGEELGERGYINHYDIFDDTVKTFLLIKNPTIDKKDVIIEQQTQSINILPTILDFLKIPLSHQIEGSSLVPLINGQNKNENEYVFIERTPLWERVMFQGYVLDNKIKSASPEKIYLNSTAERQSKFYNKETIQYIQSGPFLDQKDFAVRTNDWKLIYRKSKLFQEKYSWWKVLGGATAQIKDFELYDLKTDPKEQENVIEKYPSVANDLKEKLNIFIKNFGTGKSAPQLKNTIQEYF